MNQETGDSILVGIQLLNLHSARVESLLYMQNIVLRLLLVVSVVSIVLFGFLLRKRFSNGV